MKNQMRTRLFTVPYYFARSFRCGASYCQWPPSCFSHVPRGQASGIIALVGGRGREKTGSFNKGLKIKSTTVLLSGGWLPVIPRSFHYGQPASYLAGKSWQPSQEPPSGREESRHRHNENISGKEGGKKPLINWVTTFVIRPRWIKHAKSWQTHKNGWTLNALDHAKMHTGPRAW